MGGKASLHGCSLHAPGKLSRYRPACAGYSCDDGQVCARLVKPLRKWLLGAGVAALILLGVFAALLIFVPSDKDLAATASTKLTTALGVKVDVGSLRWRLLPVPVLVVENVVAELPQPITLRHVTLYPSPSELLHKKVRIVRADVDGAVLPQLSVRGLRKKGAMGNNADGGESGFKLDETPLSHLVFRDVTWISRRGIPVVYEGEIDFDDHWRPRTVEMRRPGFKPATNLELTRQDEEDRWTVRINIGGGTLNGEAALQTLPDGKMHLDGKLKPTGIEVSSALEAFNRRPAVAGKASGNTTISADGSTVGELGRSFRTVTPFVMGPSTILRFDLDKAIKTAGKKHGGQTPLDGITGTLETQNTPDGMISYFKNIETKSGSLSAIGNAKLFNRHIDAEFAVDIVKGVVGVPLKVTGPVNNITVSVPGGAIAGAVVGTAVLPGVGTVIGARIGAALGKIFGSGPNPPKGPASAPRQAR